MSLVHGIRRMWVLLLWLWIVLHSIIIVVTEASNVPCEKDEDCVRLLRPGSRCDPQTQKCTNPFHDGGCLKSLVPDWDQIRTCNSDDPKEALEKGYCQLSPLDYTEIRLAGANWESSVIHTWLGQIILTELLHVPCSIERGYQLQDPIAESMSFYQPQSNFDFWNTKLRQYDGFITAAQHDGICTSITSEHEDDDQNHEEDEEVVIYKNTYENDFKPCYHVRLEQWWSTQDTTWPGGEEIDDVLDVGALSELAMYVPKFAVERDPTIVSYIGLSGEDNRPKLASFFRTPLRYQEYCQRISTSNCTEPDDHASRPPLPQEATKYFIDGGIYNGYFHLREENNCTNYPDTCVGSFIQVNCDWDTYAKQIFYHLQIALEGSGHMLNGGYSYGDQYDIYAAAAKTQSPVMILIYTTDPPYAQYLGTSAEFQRVNFPPPTYECIQNRISVFDQCNVNATFDELYGSPLGACDTYVEPLKKVLSKSFHHATKGKHIPPEFHSPAYEAIRHYQVTELDYREIYNLWFDRQTDPHGYDLRDATCQWVVNHLDTIRTNLIPESYPRMIQYEDDATTSYTGTLRILSLFLACLALTLVLASMIITRRKRHAPAIQQGQIEFLYLLLVGLAMLSIAAMTITFNPTNVVCITAVWLINLGYTLEFVPLIVKVGALNLLLQSAKKMRRMKLDRKLLFRVVAVWTFLTVSFLSCWTILDPPKRKEYYELTTELTDHGETIIHGTYQCDYESDIWRYVSFATTFLYLMIATVLAGQTRNVPQKGLNESRTLAIMIYSHFVFTVLRGIIQFVLQGEDGFVGVSSAIVGAQSIVISCDVIATIGIYFVPKFAKKKKSSSQSQQQQRFSVFTRKGMVQFFESTKAIFETYDTERAASETIASERNTTTPLQRNSSVEEILEFLEDYDEKKEEDDDDHHHHDCTPNVPHNDNETREEVIPLLRSCPNCGWDGIDDDKDNDENDHNYLGNGEEIWIYYNLEIFHELTQQIMARRDDTATTTTLTSTADATITTTATTHSEVANATMPLDDEVQDVIHFPNLNQNSFRRQLENNSIEIPEVVMEQLRDYITTIASCCHDHPFHSFEHASFVVMALTKYMNRIVQDVDQVSGEKEEDCQQAHSQRMTKLHFQTYGITSDPLTQFAMVFAAMIHNVDHPGVTNVQFLRENKGAAEHYNQDSSIQQMSLDVAWYLLLEDRFSDLLSTICQTPVELLRFRQLVVNSVMATTVDDKKHRTLQEQRWEKAFANDAIPTGKRKNGPSNQDPNSRHSLQGPVTAARNDAIDRKATAVIENLVQAAVLSHMSQPWRIYRKWNERLFLERYKAWLDGRCQKHPAEFWYKQQIVVFDTYVLSTCRKLRDCGIFGLNSDETMNAEINRNLWVNTGKEIMKEMSEKAVSSYPSRKSCNSNQINDL